MEAGAILTWTLVKECPIPDDVTSVLVSGEVAIAAYKTFRDSAIFTDRRLIVRDAQGLTGKKVEIYSLPYSMIHMWSSENAGKIDWNSELELWTRAGHIKVKLNKGLDIRRLDKLIAEAVLGSAEGRSLSAYESPAVPVAGSPSAVAESAQTGAASTASAEAGWHPDPKGVHELRYWDGASWTEHVSNAGVQSTAAL